MIFICAMRGRQEEKDGDWIQQLEISGKDFSNSLTTVQKDNLILEVIEDETKRV